MNERLTFLRAKTSFAFLAFLFTFLTLLCGKASAGTGTFRKTGPDTGVFDFCVSVRFNATQTQLDRIKLGFDAASQVLADAPDGHHRFGTVNIVNDSGAQEVAEFFIDFDNKRAMAAPGFYGDPRGRSTLHYLVDFGGDSTNPIAILNSAYTIAHEFAHLAYNVYDEYPRTAAEIAAGAECAPPPIPPKTYADEPNLSYCLMDNFYARGGWPGGLRTFTLNEFCVASNHDKPNVNGVGLTILPSKSSTENPAGRRLLHCENPGRYRPRSQASQ